MTDLPGLFKSIAIPLAIIGLCLIVIRQFFWTKLANEALAAKKKKNDHPSYQLVCQIELVAAFSLLTVLLKAGRFNLFNHLNPLHYLLFIIYILVRINKIFIEGDPTFWNTLKSPLGIIIIVCGIIQLLMADMLELVWLPLLYCFSFTLGLIINSMLKKSGTRRNPNY